MNNLKDPFEALIVEERLDEFELLTRKLPSPVSSVDTGGAVTARFHGFDPQDRPLIVGLQGSPHEILLARTTVPLLQSQIGSSVVLLFENADVRCPIIIGVLQERQSVSIGAGISQPLVSVQADDDCFVVSAEREIVLRCGDASITLTRSGKVLISGKYILSRSKGVNKIKGAMVDIN